MDGIFSFPRPSDYLGQLPYLHVCVRLSVAQVYPVSPVAGPGAARSVWELSPDPDMVGHLPNNPISGANQPNHHHGTGKDAQQRSPDDNIYADETTTGQSPTDETKQILELLRAGLDINLFLTPRIKIQSEKAVSSGGNERIRVAAFFKRREK